MSSRSLAVAIAIACALVAPRARAQEPATDAQLAQSLFDQGRAFMEARKYAEACPKLAESQRLDPGAGTYLNLALCHAKEGKSATAWSEFNVALSQAIKDKRDDRVAIAREQIAALDPIVPRLTVAVLAADVPGIDVKLDGVSLGKAAWNTPAAVDPGSHRVEASAPGRIPWSELVALADSERKQVQVPSLTVDPDAPPPPPKAEAWETITKPNPVFYGALAIGAAALLTSGITGAFALSEHSSSADVCQPARQYCSDPTGITAAGNARTLAITSTVALGVGVLAAASLLFIPTRFNATPPPKNQSGALGLFVAPLPGGAAVSVRMPLF